MSTWLVQWHGQVGFLITMPDCRRRTRPPDIQTGLHIRQRVVTVSKMTYYDMSHGRSKWRALVNMITVPRVPHTLPPPPKKKIWPDKRLLSAQEKMCYMERITYRNKKPVSWAIFEDKNMLYSLWHTYHILWTTPRRNMIGRNLKTRGQVTGNEPRHTQVNFIIPTFQNRRHSTVLRVAGQAGRRAGTITADRGMVF